MAKIYKFSDFLHRSKIPIDILDSENYKRVTIKTKHGGVSLRDTEIGKKIGTKKQFVLKSGQFILSKIDARYGAFGIAPEEVDNCIITGNFWAYDVDFNLIDINWFNQYTNSRDFYDLCERASSGITHRKYLSESAFLNNEILLPDLDEQRNSMFKIENLKSLDYNISTELTHQLSLISQLRQAFLREAMQGTLVSNETSDGKTGADLLAEIKKEKEQLIKDKKIKKGKPLPPISEEEIPFDIPENWVWCRLGEISVLNPRNKVDDDLDVGFCPMPLIYSDFQKHNDFEIRKWNQIKSGFTHFKDNDLVIAKITPCFQNSKNAVIHGLPNKIGAGTTELHVLRLLFSNPYLYYYFTKSSKFLKEGERTMRGVAGQQRVPTEFIENYIFPLPPLQIQDRIVAKLDELMQYCHALEASVKESQNYNAQLLQQVLREALEGKEESKEEAVALVAEDEEIYQKKK
ncbi:restriction endonuclease subunit S [Chryseobacterium taklimakanense]|uniref:restriction endonuclease subunit S n=1 Tax=Chryseobacterium taklimakanense TaxID=536441 RepID=UPI000F5F3D41|nr:restriction endonuclease subunit S [Chryseobacterium taklimakanense]AZI22719.1 restriction endonuclease subunit S [Chryseobacterium taklimakanense]